MYAALSPLSVVGWTAFAALCLVALKFGWLSVLDAAETMYLRKRSHAPVNWPILDTTLAGVLLTVPTHGAIRLLDTLTTGQLPRFHGLLQVVMMVLLGFGFTAALIRTQVQYYSNSAHRAVQACLARSAQRATETSKVK